MSEVLLDTEEWPAAVGYLTEAQEGIFLRLWMWCRHAGPERVLPVDIEQIVGIARVSRQHRDDLDIVLARLFSKTAEGFARIAFVSEQKHRLQTRRAASERRAKSRADRSKLFEQAHAAGLKPSFRATMTELESMLSGKTTSPGERLDESRGESLVEGRDECPGFLRVPLSSSSLRSEEGESAREGTRAGLACRAIRRAGMQAVNPSHPGLVRLLEAGVTDEELALAAAECVARGKAFPYLLAVVEGRRRDAAAKAPVTPAADILAQLAPLALAAMNEGRDPFAMEG